MTKKDKLNEKDHPFPNEELKLIIKFSQEKTINVEDVEILSNLILKYLNLRSEVFHDY